MAIVHPDCGGREVMPPICKAFGPGLTKMFHVKHFGPIDGLRKRIFAREGEYEAEVWRKRTIGIGLSFWPYVFGMVRIDLRFEQRTWCVGWITLGAAVSGGSHLLTM